jgi:hypothetical protein
MGAGQGRRSGGRSREGGPSAGASEFLLVRKMAIVRADALRPEHRLLGSGTRSVGTGEVDQATPPLAAATRPVPCDTTRA